MAPQTIQNEVLLPALLSAVRQNPMPRAGCAPWGHQVLQCPTSTPQEIPVTHSQVCSAAAGATALPGTRAPSKRAARTAPRLSLRIWVFLYKANPRFLLVPRHFLQWLSWLVPSGSPAGAGMGQQQFWGLARQKLPSWCGQARSVRTPGSPQPQVGSRAGSSLPPCRLQPSAVGGRQLPRR